MDGCRLKDFYFKHKIYEMHLHDALNNKDHLCLGEGNININEYLSLLNDDSLVVIEVKDKVDLIESIKKVRKCQRK